ncbi:MAG: SLBB domain-containing protein [Terriglobales bacterium]
MTLNRFFFAVVFFSGIAAAQTSLRVPSGSASQCDGPNCVNNSQSNANSSADDVDANDQSSLQDQSSQYSRRSTQGYPTRSANQNGRYSRSTQDDLQRSGEDELPSNSAEPLDLSLTYPPHNQQQAREQQTEFQKFVYSSTGQRLPIYGHNLFENVPSTFAPVDRIPVPADYVVGPGDELLIRAWGQIDLDARVVVDRSGQIYLPRVGSVNVAGLKYEQVNPYLKTAVGRIFKNFDLNVNLGQLRSIQVFVVGQAKHPGTYTVSSLSTLVNALFASGGPDATGSMRHIQLKRKNQVVSEFDLYDLLLNGDKSKDVALLPGDVIYIPPVGQLVAIAGSVNMPAIYEIRDKTIVADELEIAGGLNTTADSSRAVLERIENRTTRKVDEFALDKEGANRELQNGDVLRVFSVSPRFENAVILRGNVAQPGRYPWRDGMHVCDLIPSRDAIIKRDYWMRQNSLALTPISWTNNTDDRRTVFARNTAEVNWDYAVVQRLNHQDLTARLFPFNLGHAITDCRSEDNLQLVAGDVITIFSQNDLAVPVEQRTKFVWLEGEVNRAGVYRVQKGETLRDVVERAGGLTPNAYLFASDFRRESARVSQQKDLERLTQEFDKELRNKAAQVGGKGSQEEQMAFQAQLQAQESVLAKLRETQATGRIVLGLKPNDAEVADIPALPLQDGDRLTVPAKPATVDVLGAVYNQNSFMYQDGRGLHDYLGQAGGGTRDADEKRLYVVRADGSVESKQMHRSMFFGNFESLKMMPGDTVIMPQKIRTSNSLVAFRDWTQIFSQLALGAASISVLSK